MSGAGARPPASVSLRGLEKRFDAAPPALHPLDLEVQPGEFLVLVGPSGCGKSTVLRLIAGLEEPTAGEVWIGGRPVAEVEPADRDVAMVFQNYALYPHMTVRENLAFGLRMRRTPAALAAERVDWAAGVLGLGPLLERRPGQLSGGEKQRVAFGRAMVREPQVFLFDEPLSNLDARLRADMRREIADLHARLGVTLIYVTHDQVEAMTLGQRIAVMRGGRLQQVASPLEVYQRPANLFVAGFIGTPAINLAEGALANGRFTAGRLSLPVERGAGTARAVLAVRPEDLKIRSGRISTQSAAGIRRPEDLRLSSKIGSGVFSGPVAAEITPDPFSEDFVSVVRRVEVLGNESLVHLDGPAGAGQPWVARVAADWAGAVGTVLHVTLAREHLHLFDAAEGHRLDARVAGTAP